MLPNVRWHHLDLCWPVPMQCAFYVLAIQGFVSTLAALSPLTTSGSYGMKTSKEHGGTSENRIPADEMTKRGRPNFSPTSTRPMYIRETGHATGSSKRSTTKFKSDSWLLTPDGCYLKQPKEDFAKHSEGNPPGGRQAGKQGTNKNAQMQRTLNIDGAMAWQFPEWQASGKHTMSCSGLE